MTSAVQDQPFIFFGCDDLKDNEICLYLTKTCDAQPEKRWVPTYYFDICSARQKSTIWIT